MLKRDTWSPSSLHLYGQNSGKYGSLISLVAKGTLDHTVGVLDCYYIKYANQNALHHSPQVTRHQPGAVHPVVRHKSCVEPDFLVSVARSIRILKLVRRL